MLQSLADEVLALFQARIEFHILLIRSTKDRLAAQRQEHLLENLVTLLSDAQKVLDAHHEDTMMIVTIEEGSREEQLCMRKSHANLAENRGHHPGTLLLLVLNLGAAVEETFMNLPDVVEMTTTTTPVIVAELAQ